MMSPSPRGLNTGQNPSWAQNFWNKVHRYRQLMRKNWWVLLFTLSVMLFLGAYYQISRPPTFLSTATLYNDVETRQVTVGSPTDAGPVPADGILDREATVIATLPLIRDLAVKQLQARYPNQPAAPVNLTAKADTSLLMLTAMGSDPLYTQRYLQAVVQNATGNRWKTSATSRFPARKGTSTPTIRRSSPSSASTKWFLTGKIPTTKACWRSTRSSGRSGTNTTSWR